MNKYEGMFLMDPRPFTKGWEEARDLIQGILNKYQGKIVDSGKWDERKISFEVKKQKRGLYVLVYFEAPANAIPGIERECQLTENVLRVLILRLEGEIPKDAFKPAPPPEAVAHRAAPAERPVEVIPELAEIEGSGPLDWEEQP